MTVDDILAYMASTPPRKRPVGLRSAKAMLTAWLALRDDAAFRFDTLERHRMGVHGTGWLGTPRFEHAISNAWHMAVDAVVESEVTR